jgi:hypothetical protein
MFVDFGLRKRAVDGYIVCPAELDSSCLKPLSVVSHRSYGSRDDRFLGIASAHLICAAGQSVLTLRSAGSGIFRTAECGRDTGERSDPHDSGGPLLGVHIDVTAGPLSECVTGQSIWLQPTPSKRASVPLPSSTRLLSVLGRRMATINLGPSNAGSVFPAWRFAAHARYESTVDYLHAFGQPLGLILREFKRYRFSSKDCD